MIGIIELISQLALHLKKPARSLWLASAVSKMRNEYEILAPPPAQATLDKTITEARSHLDEQVAATAWAEGAAMTFDETVAYALRE